ncbi:MAG: tetratricopeptide repeat protein, partial [Flavobacterium sp.]
MKKIFIVILVLISLVSIRSQTLYEKGFKEYDNAHFEAAIKLFTSSIEKNEKVVDSYIYRGMSYLLLENANEAKKDLDKAYEIDPDNLGINGYYGKYFYATDQYGKALENYNIALSKKPNNYSLYSERAGTKAMLGMYSEAMKDADVAVKNSPSDYNVYLNRGYVKLRLEKYSEAVEDFNQSLKIEESHKGYGNRGTAYALLKKYDLAINDFNKALKYNPNDLLVLYYQGEVYLAKGEKIKACENFLKSKLSASVS